MNEQATTTGRASWIPFSTTSQPGGALRDLVELNKKVIRGIEILSRVREEDICVGVSAKEEVWRQDNVALYRFSPLVQRPFPVPVLVVYALVNRPYMIDLQEDRSISRTC